MAEVLSREETTEYVSSSEIIDASDRINVAFNNILNFTFKKFEDMLIELL